MSKKTLSILLILILISIPVTAQDTWRQRMREKWQNWVQDRSKDNVPADYEFSIYHAGSKRRYIVHVPPSYQATVPTAVILAFHGGGGNADDSAEYFGLNTTSDKEGFIVVYPEGTGAMVKGKVFGTWNSGTCCGPAMKNNVDDVGFVDKMIEKLKNDFNIDQDRIYATGMSNGALMCYRLACELSDKIAAIAPSGAHDAIDSCAPTRPIPIIHFHGTEDNCASYNGGTCGGCIADFFSDMGIDIPKHQWDCMSAAEYLEEWRKRNGCYQQNQITYKKGKASCITYQNCRDNAEVTFCTITGMGHVWPGSKKHNVKACRTKPDGYICNSWKKQVGNLSSDLSANELMWEFFQKHPKQ